MTFDDNDFTNITVCSAMILGEKLNSAYYYTDFETFRLIIKNGTLRFKESTQSNDRLDTNILYDELREIFEERYKNDKLKSSQLQFLIGFFENQGYRNKSVPVVACFTKKADSRLLWDAYTMHRSGRKSERYNGVCLQVNLNSLSDAMQKCCTERDLFLIMDIMYDKASRRDFLVKKLDDFDILVRELAEDKDQSQDLIPSMTFSSPSGRVVFEQSLKKCIVYPMMKFVNDLQIMSPLFKHEFWIEEDEIRALFCKPEDELEKLPSGAHYYDIPLTKDIIERVILGPEFSDKDMEILKRENNAIDIDICLFTSSIGTGVITSKN